MPCDPNQLLEEAKCIMTCIPAGMRGAASVAALCQIAGGATPPPDPGNTFASDGSLEDVQLIHDTLAQDGDTITIPVGTFGWSGQLNFTKAVTLRGLGTQTLDGNGRTTDTTSIIRDDRAAGILIEISLVEDRLTRITGIKFVSGGNRTPGEVSAIIQINGTDIDDRRFRCDHCFFDHCVVSALAPHTVLGVIDHNTVIGQNQLLLMYVKCESWGGTQAVDLYGDGSYVDADGFGTEKFLFVENNNLTCDWIGHITIIDGSYGSRVVVRYNTITQGSVENHGAESDRGRSGRAGELYNNVFVGNSGGSSVLFSRGGVWIVHDNTVSGYFGANLNLLNDRSREPLFAPFGPCDGRNPWDDNDAGSPFDTGTVTTGSVVESPNVSFKVTDASKAWTPNEWAGYTIRRTSGKTVSSLTLVAGFIGTVECVGHGFSPGDHISIFDANEYAWNYRYTVFDVPDVDHFRFLTNWVAPTPATGSIKACLGSWFAAIFSNTATELVYNDSFYYDIDTDFPLALAPGDTFEINKVNTAMDMVGVGSGANLGGVAVPAVQAIGAITPNYEWNNTYEAGADVQFTNGAVGGPYLIIQEGVHYFNNTVKPGYVPFTYPHPLTV